MTRRAWCAAAGAMCSMVAVSAAMVATAARPAMAQQARSIDAGELRPEWTVEAARGGGARVVGYLYNDNATRDAANVLLRVDRLGADGAVAGTYTGRVMGDVRQGGRLPFDVAVAEPASTYRVVVENVDWVRECR